MGQANRLISNILVTYARMALTIGIGLVTTRLLLATLGEVDFGLFFVLGGGLSLIMVISTALADAAQRHLAFEIGRGDQVALREVFSTSVIIYLALGLIIAGLGVALRPILLSALTIPSQRLAAAGLVYNLTLLNLCFSVFATPFLALFLARQAMVQDAVFAILTSLLGLLAILLTPHVHTDHLIGYAILITSVRLALMAAQIARGLLVFPESRFRARCIQRSRARDLMGFAGWTFLGSLAWQLRSQGGQIVLNVFFGPSLNAAFALANQVAMYMTNFAGAIMKASRPAMTSLEGKGQRQNMRHMVLSTSKLTAIILALIAIPMLVETSTILDLWLLKTPDYAVIFVCLTVLWTLLFQLTSGHGSGIIADGRIGKFTRYGALITVSPLPLSAVLYLVTDASPVWYIILVIASIVGLQLLRVFYGGKLLEIPAEYWLKEVFYPVSVAVIPPLVLCLIIRLILPEGLPRLSTITIASVASTSILLWKVTLNENERKLLVRFIQSIRERSLRN